jgi:hypothetical protein
MLRQRPTRSPAKSQNFHVSRKQVRRLSVRKLQVSLCFLRLVLRCFSLGQLDDVSQAEGVKSFAVRSGAESVKVVGNASLWKKSEGLLQ